MLLLATWKLSWFLGLETSWRLKGYWSASIRKTEIKISLCWVIWKASQGREYFANPIRSCCLEKTPLQEASVFCNWKSKLFGRYSVDEDQSVADRRDCLGTALNSARIAEQKRNIRRLNPRFILLKWLRFGRIRIMYCSLPWSLETKSWSWFAKGNLLTCRRLTLTNRVSLDVYGVWVNPPEVDI